MNIESELESKLCCKTCNKIYASMSSLCNHNKKFHSKNNKFAIQCNTIIEDNSIKVILNEIKCNFCNRIFNNRQNKWKHEKICKHKKIDNSELEIKKIELDKLKEQNEMIRLKIKLQNCKRIDNKTFKSVNKMLMDRSFRNSNNNNNNINCNNTNITNNNNIILSLGNEDLSNNLTLKEKRAILDRKYCSLEKIVELVHCGNRDKFKNILITNLKDNYAYKYDETLRYFLTVPKNELLNDVVSNRLGDIEEIYDNLSKRNKIDNNTKEIIQLMLNKITDDKTTYYDDDGDTNYQNYKSYKINNIKILLYNNNDKITRDIELLFSKYVNEKPVDIDLIPKNASEKPIDMLK